MPWHPPATEPCRERTRQKDGRGRWDLAVQTPPPCSGCLSPRGAARPVRPPAQALPAGGTHAHLFPSLAVTGALGLWTKPSGPSSARHRIYRVSCSPRTWAPCSKRRGVLLKLPKRHASPAVRSLRSPLPPRFAGAAQGRKAPFARTRGVHRAPETRTQTRPPGWGLRSRAACAASGHVSVHRTGRRRQNPPHGFAPRCPHPAALGRERAPGGPRAFCVLCLPSAFEESLVPREGGASQPSVADEPGR